MVRSLGITAVVVGLAWTGLAGAQTVPPGTTAPRERYLTVREEGKPPQRCKLLKTWRERNGGTAYQVQAVDTGELMTIVESGAAPVEPGAARSKPTASRIFRWGRDNKPPAQAPLPPSTATVLGAPLSQPASAPPTLQPTPPRAPAHFATMPRKAESAVLTSRKPEPAIPAPILSQPLTQSPSTVLAAPKPDGASKSQVTVVTPPATAKLVPTPAGQSTPCGSCGESACVCGNAPHLRQTWRDRIFKSRAPTSVCDCPPDAAKPTAPAARTTIAKQATEPARPGNWRESWGKAEPWKEEPAKRVARAPAPMEAPKQADPIKDPAFYRGMALKQEPPSSYSPDKHTAIASRGKEKPARTRGGPETTPPPPESLGMTPGRVVTLPAEEGNAFWTPPTPPKGAKGAKNAKGQKEPNEAEEPSGPRYNAFDRGPNQPPPNAAVAMAGDPQGAMPMAPPGMGQMPMVPPGMGPMGMGGPGGGPMAMRGMPPPPMGPMPNLPQGPHVPSPPPTIDTGVPSGMANAFTVAGTRRPIPADFGGTPQEPNGFGTSGVTVEGPAHPPQPYVMPSMPGAARPPMPGMMPMMPPQAPVPGMNPLMSVPPTPVAANRPAGLPESGNAPKLLTVLMESQLPSQREWAAEQLSELNWRFQPGVVESLTTTAKSDPAPTVRAACVHALAQMKVDRPDVVTVVQELRNDIDPRVRSEVEEALGALATAPHSDGGIRPVSHR